MSTRKYKCRSYSTRANLSASDALRLGFLGILVGASLLTTGLRQVQAQENAAKTARELTIAPDPRVEAELERWSRLRPWRTEFYEPVIVLARLARELGAPYIWRQAALFSAHREDWTAFNYCKWQLQIGGEDEAARTLVPYLNSPDEKLRRFAETYFEAETAQQEEEKPLTDVKVSALLSSVSGRPTPLEQRAIQILFWQAPSGAFVQLGVSAAQHDLAKIREVQLSEHIVSDAVWRLERDLLDAQQEHAALAELDRLSRMDAWWAKLYVAEMVRRHETFRRPELLERLRKDPDPLIAKAADVPYHPGLTEEGVKGWEKAIPGFQSRPR